ncbi:3-isopropylmalate dehydratase small subunit [Sulfitobacter sp. F26204]|uniref:3-isopropylmalate dehydratase small subunit n=1 Tax=Sulfitobacter sp. F26204 TaxID=2996014 RepID=UPI00225E1B5D|nr:3-isopropylmalate dehydratase small subunit [Sulfitobacter sp. F26204]MCX7560621.1 3-isopropylmalate dehydratase small subunit [Sulfitobacter sp. F26204]
MTGPILAVTGCGLPLPGNNIDTDQIIESRYLKLTSFQGMETHVFESLRQMARTAGATPHPFDDPRYKEASVLVVGRNFGCGSSREHAPQALYRYGIRAIIGQSFGEIFVGNCLSIGLPCVEVAAKDEAKLQDLCREFPTQCITVDIAKGVIFAGQRQFSAALEEGRKQRLVSGSWDSLNVLLDAAEHTRTKLQELPVINPIKTGTT